MEVNVNRKLCLLIPSLQPGGMERVMSELARCFCMKRDLTVHLVLYGRKPEIFYNILDNVLIHKPKSPFNNTFRSIASLSRMIYLRKKVKTIDPDSILSFGEYWNSFVLIALYGLNYPVYVSDRCQPDKKLTKYHDKLRKWLYPKTTGIIAQTLKAKQIYHDQFKHNNIKVIGNPINISNKFLNPEGKENIVLTIGRLIKTKNHDKLIEMFVRINKPGWKLIIVGDDAQKQNQKSRLQTLIKDLNAGEIIIMTGTISNVEQYYLRSKIFAFTSDSEGFPNVIGEAQTYGLPVIAFDCVAGPSDLVHDKKNGFLIPLYNYSLYEEKLTLLMNDKEIREQFGSNARQSIKKFSTEHIGGQYYNFIMGLK